MTAAAVAVEPELLLELRRVSKIYGKGAAEVRALDGVDLRIYEGEFVAIMGPAARENPRA